MTKVPGDKSNGKEDEENAIALFYENLFIVWDDSGFLFSKQSEFISKCGHNIYYTGRKEGNNLLNGNNLS